MMVKRMGRAIETTSNSESQRKLERHKLVHLSKGRFSSVLSIYAGIESLLIVRESLEVVPRCLGLKR